MQAWFSTSCQSFDFRAAGIRGCGPDIASRRTTSHAMSLRRVTRTDTCMAQRRSRRSLLGLQPTRCTCCAFPRMSGRVSDSLTATGCRIPNTVTCGIDTTRRSASPLMPRPLCHSANSRHRNCELPRHIDKVENCLSETSSWSTICDKISKLYLSFHVLFCEEILKNRNMYRD